MHVFTYRKSYARPLTTIKPPLSILTNHFHPIRLRALTKQMVKLGNAKLFAPASLSTAQHDIFSGAAKPPATPKTATCALRKSPSRATSPSVAKRVTTKAVPAPPPTTTTTNIESMDSRIKMVEVSIKESGEAAVVAAAALRKGIGAAFTKVDSGLKDLSELGDAISKW